MARRSQITRVRRQDGSSQFRKIALRHPQHRLCRRHARAQRQGMRPHPLRRPAAPGSQRPRADRPVSFSPDHLAFFFNAACMRGSLLTRYTSFNQKAKTMFQRSNLSTRHAYFPPGMEVLLAGRSKPNYFIRANYGDNEHGPYGRSSPQWVKSFFVSQSKTSAIAFSKRVTTIAKILHMNRRDPDPSCTLNSEQSGMIIVVRNGTAMVGKRRWMAWSFSPQRLRWTSLRSLLQR